MPLGKWYVVTHLLAKLQSGLAGTAGTSSTVPATAPSEETPPKPKKPRRRNPVTNVDETDSDV